MRLDTELRMRFEDDFHADEPISKHTSARIGGPADYLIIARMEEDIRDAAAMAWANDLPFCVIGGGSNILISDKGVRGIVVINKTSELAMIDDGIVLASSGYSTIKLSRWCATQGLTGFEWAIGVPGTVGGAVVGNAGAHNGDMSKSVVEVKAVIPSADHSTQMAVWSNEELAFEYRNSAIKREKRRCALLSVSLNFEPDDPDAINARMQEFTTHRKRTQPQGATIGSTFKNPDGDYAGRLIEAAGLKGKRVGGAEISKKHANFFLNRDDATAEDVMTLAKLAQEEVAKQFNIGLELEIEPIGEW